MALAFSCEANAPTCTKYARADGDAVFFLTLAVTAFFGPGAGAPVKPFCPPGAFPSPDSPDPKLMKEIMDLLKSICEEKGITLVTSLHFLDFAKRYGSRIIGMREGKVVFDGKPEELTEKDIVDIYGKTKDWYLYGKTGF